MYVVPKSWGFEIWVINVDYCGKQLTVMPTKYCSIHKHLKKDEVFYVIDGSLRLQYTEIELCDAVVDEMY